MIKFLNMSYKYKSSKDWVLKNISCEIRKGEFIGIVGRGKAGKSTFCQAISGLVPHFYGGTISGAVHIQGMIGNNDENSVAEIAQKVGLVLQEPFTQLTGIKETVFAEVAFGLENMGVAPGIMKERVKNVLSILGIENLAYKHPLHLSGGQMQRVAIAGILAMQPEILVLDEPTSQLDPESTKVVFTILKELQMRGYTVVLVENKPELMAEHAERIIYLEQGELVAIDKPSVIYNLLEVRRHVRIPAYTDIFCTAAKDQEALKKYPVTLEEAKNLLVQDLDIAAIKAVIEMKKSVREEMPLSETLVKLDDVSFSYSDRKNVLSNISLTIAAGATAIVGQNGAGKTTLVKLCKKLLELPENNVGTIEICGKNIKDYSAARLAADIGLVLQNPNEQIFKATVMEEVMVGPLAIGQCKNEAEANATAALKETKLWEMREANPYDLSLAERKLLGLASVLAMKTKVVILDEPTIAQDLRGLMIIATVIKRLKNEGKAVITIIHDMDFVLENFDNVVVLSEGAKICAGDAETVFACSEVLRQAGLTEPYAYKLKQYLIDNE